MIRVNDDWVIMVDSMNYTPLRDLHRTRKAYQEDGTEKLEPAYGRPIGYYTDLAGAVKAIARAEYKNSLSGREVPLNEAVAMIKETVGRFERILESIEK